MDGAARKMILLRSLLFAPNGCMIDATVVIDVITSSTTMVARDDKDEPLN